MEFRVTQLKPHTIPDNLNLVSLEKIDFSLAKNIEPIVIVLIFVLSGFFSFFYARVTIFLTTSKISELPRATPKVPLHGAPVEERVSEALLQAVRLLG